MAYVTAEARQELLDTVAEATDELGKAITALGDAYEALDEHSADTLEERLFRPLQGAFGRASRTHSEFAERHGLPTINFTPAPGGSVRPVGELLESAAEAVEQARAILSELQDSMSPVEVGDPPLRAGLAEIRKVIDELPARFERFTGRLGR